MFNFHLCIILTLCTRILKATSLDDSFKLHVLVMSHAKFGLNYNPIIFYVETVLWEQSYWIPWIPDGGHHL